MKIKGRWLEYGGIAAVLVCVVALNSYFRGDSDVVVETETAPNENPFTGAVRSRPVAEGIEEVRKERQRLDDTVLRKEILAQEYEQGIVKYWDRMLKPTDDKYAVLADFPFDTVTLGKAQETTELDWGIKRTQFGGVWKTLDRAGWKAFLRDMKE